jgi:hypothetical protein
MPEREDFLKRAAFAAFQLTNVNVVTKVLGIGSSTLRRKIIALKTSCENILPHSNKSHLMLRMKLNDDQMDFLLKFKNNSK